ncbi:MAG: flippase [Bacteroidota bacterium]
MERSIGKNTLINLTGALVPFLVSLMVVPPYLHRIGEARYGVLAIVWLILGFFGVFDLGMGKVCANQMARFRHDRPEECGKVFWTILLINSLLGIAGGALLCGIGWLLLGQLFKIPADLRPEALATLPWLSFSVLLTTLSTAFQGTLEGWERFDRANLLSVTSNLLSQVIPLLVATLQGPALGPLVASIVLVRFFQILLAFFACLSLSPTLRRIRIDFSRAKELFSYGGWLSVTWLVSPLLMALDRALIGTQLGAAAVGHYAIPANLVTRVQILPESLSRSLFPRFSALEAGETQTLGKEALNTLLAIMTPLTILAIGLIRPFLTRWVGPQLGNLTAPVGVILLLGIWINSLAFIPYTALQGQGRPDLTAKFHLLEVPCYVGALWLGMSSFGLPGAALAWTFRVSLDALLLFGATRWKAPLLAPCAGMVLLSGLGTLACWSHPLYPVLQGVWFCLALCLAAWLAPPSLKAKLQQNTALA